MSVAVSRSLLLILLLGWVSITYAQSQQRYNRFQYHKYKWKTFHTKAFHIYFPQGYDSLASFTTRELPDAIKKVKRNMGTSLLKEPNIIIYPSVTQLYESNIGYSEPINYTLPTFVAKGNRMLIAYDGNYEHFKQQLYESIVRSIWEAWLKEENDLAKQVNDKPEDIPNWFKEGAIAYFAHGWTIEAEDKLRSNYSQNFYTNWQQVTATHPKLAGQAFLYFLEDQYYPQAPMQLLGQLRKKKNLQRAQRLLTKKPLDTVLAECYRFYQARFQEQHTTVPTVITSMTIPKKKGILKEVKASPDGKHIAYTVYRNRKRTTYNYNSLNKETKRLISYRLPPWITDYSRDMYPILQWTNDGSEINTVLPIKSKLTLTSYSNTGQKTDRVEITGTDGINQIEVIKDYQYLLSAYSKGQSDIVEYDGLKEKYIPFTNDPYDDGTPARNSNNPAQLFFTSRRKEKEPTDEQKRTIGFKDTTIQNQGIFTIKDKFITPVLTDSISYIHWNKLITLPQGQLLTTHTKYGTERFAFIPNPNTANPTLQTLHQHEPIQYLATQQAISYHRQKGDSIEIISEPLKDWISRNINDDTTSHWLDDYHKRAAARAKEDSILKAAKDESPSFLEGVLIPKNAKEEAQKREDSIQKALTYDSKKVKPYIIQLHSAYFSAKVNNDYFINRYQPYKNYQGQFKFPELGGMAQGGFSDILENHHVNIAFRLPAGTEGSDFFIRYENTAKKIDWGISYFRKVESLSPDPKRNWTDEEGKTYPSNAKVKTHYGEVSVHHPITYYLSAGFQEAVRYDRTVFLATDKYTLTFKDLSSIWSISTLSLTYNRLMPTLPMLYKGFKAKGLIDVFQPVAGNEGTVSGSTLQLQYHQPLYKYITLSTQLQTGYSGGKSKVLYNTGGMDNNITVRTDSNIHPQQNAPYAFQTLITRLRGYLQNTLQGNQYFVFNTDVYFPLFQTLIPIETPLQSINQLQLGLFSDIATVRETWDKTKPQKNWVWSYGISARTNLTGYPIRFDIAWPGALNKKPVWYISLNWK